MIYLFTGDGKGKTTAALGIALRSLGFSRKVLFIQFLKSGDSSENIFFKDIKNIEVKTFGQKGFFLPLEELEKKPFLKKMGVKPIGEKDRELGEEALSLFKKSIFGKTYDLIVLDEICPAINFGVVDKEELLKLLKDNQDRKDIVLTGRDCIEELKVVADLVTEIKNIKHYYQKGIKAKKGIDY
jgi:cob(I)alamin adenosyltransferase